MKRGSEGKNDNKFYTIYFTMTNLGLQKSLGERICWWMS